MFLLALIVLGCKRRARDSSTTARIGQAGDPTKSPSFMYINPIHESFDQTRIGGFTNSGTELAAAVIGFSPTSSDQFDQPLAGTPGIVGSGASNAPQYAAVGAARPVSAVYNSLTPKTSSPQYEAVGAARPVSSGYKSLTLRESPTAAYASLEKSAGMGLASHFANPAYSTLDRKVANAESGYAETVNMDPVTGSQFDAPVYAVANDYGAQGESSSDPPILTRLGPSNSGYAAFGAAPTSPPPPRSTENAMPSGDPASATRPKSTYADLGANRTVYA